MPSAAEALATLGIDLDEVRRQIEDAFGPGARWTPPGPPAAARIVVEELVQGRRAG